MWGGGGSGGLGYTFYFAFYSNTRLLKNEMQLKWTGYIEALFFLPLNGVCLIYYKAFVQITNYESTVNSGNNSMYQPL